MSNGEWKSYIVRDPDGGSHVSWVWLPMRSLADFPDPGWG